MWLATRRSNDFWEVRHWIEVWRSGSVDVYARDLSVDYPPWALPVLAWIAWLPHDIAPLLFAVVNAGVSAAAMWLLVSETDRLGQLRLSRSARAVWTLLWLASPAVRLDIWFGQTTAIAVCLACLALRWAGPRPWLAGLCLGFAAFKPTIAVGFLVVLALERRAIVLVTGACVVMALWWGYCASVHQSMATALREYAATLGWIYGHSGQLPSGLDLRPMIGDLFGNGRGADWVFVMIAATLSCTLLACVWRARRAGDSDAWVLAAGLVWSLAVFPARRYSLFLIVPALLLILVRSDLTKRTRAWLAVLMAGILVDIPLAGRLVVDHVWPVAAAGIVPLLADTNRLLVLGLFATGLVHLARCGVRPHSSPAELAKAIRR